MSATLQLRAECAEAALLTAQDAISELRDQLAETERLCATQADTITALRVEIHILRQRYGLTPDVIRELMGLVGV